MGEGLRDRETRQGRGREGTRGENGYPGPWGAGGEEERGKDNVIRGSLGLSPQRLPTPSLSLDLPPHPTGAQLQWEPRARVRPAPPCSALCPQPTAMSTHCSHPHCPLLADKQGGGMPGPLPQRRGKLDLSFVSLSITGVPELTGGQGGVTFILLAAPGQPILKASDLSYGDGISSPAPPLTALPRSWLPRADLLCSDHTPMLGVGSQPYT